MLQLAAFVCIASTLVAPLIHCEKASYDGYSVIRVIPENEEQLETLRFMKQYAHLYKLDFWSSQLLQNVPVDIMFSGESSFLRDYFTSQNLTQHVTIPNVQELIDGQISPRGDNDDFYTRYHDLDEINSWMNDTQKQYPDMVTILTVGKTYAGKEIRAFKIRGKNAVSPENPAVWIEGGIHAREWISPATVIYMTKQMLDLYGNDTNTTKMLDQLDWYILPVFNLDGYEYTWKTNRMWRKTRSPNADSECIGTDPNRNWDWHWCEAGASKDPCSDSYCGKAPFSEIEIRSVTDYMKTIKNIRGFIDFHSFGQLWMSPWGYTKELPKDYGVQIAGSKKMVEALEAVYGTVYKYGSIANIIYVASGSSADWTYGARNITFSYGVELRDTGKHGFILPDTEIEPSGLETYAALKALGLYILENSDQGSRL